MLKASSLYVVFGLGIAVRSSMSILDDYIMLVKICVIPKDRDISREIL